MKLLLPHLVRCLGFRLGVHPAYEDFLAYRDGEWGGFARSCLRAHLAGCSSCQRVAKTLDEDLQNLDRIDTSLYSHDLFNIPKGVQKLRRAIRRWETEVGGIAHALGSARASRELVLRRLVTEFDFYLGDRAGAAFQARLTSAEGRHQNPLVEADSILRDFLGPGASSAVTQRIVHLQNTMDRRVHDSHLA